MKPVIGIGANERTIINQETHWFSCIPKNFVTAIQKSGGLPVVFPIGSPEDAKAYIAGIDKLLLAGGQDISPACYGEEMNPKIEATNPARDSFELALIKEAVAQKKPILGICRGMQLLNIAFGGDLYQDLSLAGFPTLKHVQLPTPFHFSTHSVTLTADSRLGKLLGTDYHVNSFHHQAVRKIAENFQIVGKAPDGIIEALESEAFSAPIIGIQWHPEFTAPASVSEQQIFDYFVNQL